MIRNTINLDLARRTLVDAAKGVVGETARYMAERAAIHAPVDTGWLRHSIEVSISPSGMKANVQVMAHYAQWVEFGHATPSGGFVAPNPFMRRALADTERQFGEIAKGVDITRPYTDTFYLGANFSI